MNKLTTLTLILAQAIIVLMAILIGFEIGEIRHSYTFQKDSYPQVNITEYTKK